MRGIEMRRADKAREMTWCVLVDGNRVRGWFETEAEAIADLANSDEDAGMVLHLTRIGDR